MFHVKHPQYKNYLDKQIRPPYNVRRYSKRNEVPLIPRQPLHIKTKPMG
jgi:hypothetical protein